MAHRGVCVSRGSGGMPVLGKWSVVSVMGYQVEMVSTQSILEVGAVRQKIGSGTNE
jgi:hypothetical protein